VANSKHSFPCRNSGKELGRTRQNRRALGGLIRRRTISAVGSAETSRAVRSEIPARGGLESARSAAEPAPASAIDAPQGDRRATRRAARRRAGCLRPPRRCRRRERRRRPNRARRSGRAGPRVGAPAHPEQFRTGAQAFSSRSGLRSASRPPGSENAAAGRGRRPRTQMPGVAEGRLILAGPSRADGSGGGLHAEALAPGAGPGAQRAPRLSSVFKAGGEKRRFSGCRDRPPGSQPGRSAATERRTRERVRRIGSCGEGKPAACALRHKLANSRPPVAQWKFDNLLIHILMQTTLFCCI